MGHPSILGRCESCQAPIRWVRTRKGARMPLDIDMVPNGNVIIQDGFAVVIGQQSLTNFTPRYQSHFATCPNSEQWRKAKGATTT